MIKKLLFLFILFIIPSKVYASEKIIYKNNEYDIDNLISNNKIYLNINELCTKTNICEVDRNRISSSENINGIQYNYVIYVNSDKLENHLEIDKKIIEQDNYFKFDKNIINKDNIYLSLEQISYGLGKIIIDKKMENIIYIQSNIKEYFNTNYEIKISDNPKKINNNYWLNTINKPYHINVKDKNNNEFYNNIIINNIITPNNDFMINNNTIIPLKDNSNITIDSILLFGNTKFPIVVTNTFAGGPTKNKILYPKRLNYVSLGDSLAASICFDGTICKGFSEIVHNYLNENEILNTYTKDFAVSGYKTQNLINDISNNKNNIESFLKNADIITLSIGANDLFSYLKNENISFLSKIFDTDYKSIVNNIMSNTRGVLNEIVKYYKGENIIIIGYYNPISYLHKIYSNEIDELFQYTNNKLTEICNEYNIYYVDMYEDFKANSLSSRTYLPNINDVHPSEAGYKKISEEIINVIETNIIK